MIFIVVLLCMVALFRICWWVYKVVELLELQNKLLNHTNSLLEEQVQLIATLNKYSLRK